MVASNKEQLVLSTGQWFFVFLLICKCPFINVYIEGHLHIIKDIYTPHSLLCLVENELLVASKKHPLLFHHASSRSCEYLPYLWQYAGGLFINVYIYRRPLAY